MPSFFIDRPIFAWVVALFICLIGAISIPFLAVAQYPIIAPPSISVSTSYPGASPENLYNSVTRLIEEELNGASGILSFESTSDSLGQVDITANFVPGTDPSMASVEVQNRIKRVEARLPRAVIQQGILVEEASSAVLQIITLRSTDGSLDEVGLGDFMIRNVLGEVRRIPGVGRATLYSTERSLRVWIDPAKLVGYGLTADDANKAITAQNAQVASTSVGAEPSTPTQKLSPLVLLVLCLFRQRLRYSIVATIVVPLALLGSSGFLMRAGDSINRLTMFGTVLAAVILGDDARVVVEVAERDVAEEGLPPEEATR